MGQQFKQLSESHLRFIAAQKIFFVGTATAQGRVNVSPKGMDTLRALSPSRIAWLSLTGSGNETSAQAQQDPRMTVMLCALEGAPMILRIYGAATVLHRGDPEWRLLYPLFEPSPGARQIFDLSIELVQTSCGMGVPEYSFVGEREALSDWARRKGDAGIRRYWEQKNQISLDGLPTHIVEKSG